jgi:alpha/beta superfamily hydrolase
MWQAVPAASTKVAMFSMRNLQRGFAGLLAAFLLAACGGTDPNAGQSASPPPRGALLHSPPVKLASYSVADLLVQLAGNDVDKLLLQLAYTPKCAIDVYQLEYETVGGASEPTTASGALMISTGSDAACSGARPVVLYAHGTSADRNFNIADVSANTEGFLLAAIFAAGGYIVVAPNYAGYDTSALSYHPYLNGDQQSKDMIDALTAARTALPMLPAPSVTDGGKLFVTGYSQGGYVAMATHRALQAAGAVVTASAPMSGPYALAAFGDAIFYGHVPLSAPANLTLLISSYQHAYANVYSATTDVFEPQFAGDIDSLLPSATGISNLYAEGKLPQSELFSSMPPATAWAAYTPPLTPTLLAPIFAAGFGTNNLILNSYRLGYLEDAQSAPDGGFPNATTGLPAANPGNTLRQDLKLNDLRDWAPTAPVLLCGGDEDPTVFYFNTQLMQSYWATHVPPGAISVLDVDASASDSDPYAQLQGAFAVAKALIAANGGEATVLADYHTELVAPFCAAAVRSFFDGL